MKIQAVVLAITAVITLAQSAEANECKLLNVVQERADSVSQDYKRGAIKAIIEGRDHSGYEEKAKLYGAVARFNSAYMKDKECERYTVKPTNVEAFIADETIEKLNEMLQR
jgi:hypothetical protein